MTHGEGTTVSPFFGFHTREVYNSLLEWETVNSILSKLFCSDNDIHIVKMIEDVNEVENQINQKQRIQETRESNISDISNQMGKGGHNCDSGLAESSNLYGSNVFCLETSKDFHDFHGDKISPTEREAHVSLQPDQNLEVDRITSESQSNLSCGRRCSSPLLFTPVKGEDIYGAGLLSQAARQGTPTTGRQLKSTPKNLPPRFCTPSPKLIKTVKEMDSSSLSVSVGMKRSNQHCADKNKEGNYSSSDSSDLKLKHSRSERIIIPNKVGVSPNHNVQNLLGTNIESPLVPPSPFKCVQPSLKVTAAQIDSSPSPSECSDSSLFATPKKEQKSNVVARPLKLLCRNNHMRTKRKHRLRTLVSRARHSLSGIPPPPSFTNPQISVDEMLFKLGSRGIYVSFSGIACTPLGSPAKNSRSNDSPSITLDNGALCVFKTDVIVSSADNGEHTRERTDSVSSYDNPIEEGVQLEPSSSLQLQKLHHDKDCGSLSLFRPSASEEEIMNMPWPTVLDCIHIGVCYNLGTSSEALEELCQQVRERYVGNETASSCTIWSASHTSKRSSPRIRKNSNSQANTHRREGYMMRRRRAFSLASLSSTIPSMATKSRQILVNRVTKLPAESKRPNNAMDDKGKLMMKEKHNMSLLKKVFEDQERNSNKLKRSYSFNDSAASGAQLSSSASEPSFFSQSSSKLMSTKRVLKFDRLPRAASSPSLDASSSKSNLGASSSSSQNSCDNIASSGNKELSEVYKKKLLWAVAEALRSRGLGTGHEKFKSCAIPLFRRCREAFIALPSFGAGVSVGRSAEEYSIEKTCDTNSNGSTDNQKERTSDKMLNIALQLVDQVMNEVGVVPVIKGKCSTTQILSLIN
ncbi:serine-rich adhesin for platelets isoform X2 [Hetaerina americana]|uniref:serine-rich adhesin for platelets isoform X2 n=1 Tax=Hetaerina americana TaxID=62018 RepID=UPI003A7F49CE